MPIVLDGTAGIDNDATDLSYTGTLTGGTGVVNLGSGQFFKDASGNVGIGTSSPNAAMEIARAANPSGFSATGIRFVRSNYGGEVNGYINQGVGYGMIFSTVDNGNATERMRIDSSGNLLVGTTSQINSCKFGIVADPASFNFIVTRPTSNATYGAAIFGNSAGTNVGGISVSNTATAFNTSSDYRLKHDIQPMTGALARIQALKPCTYKWNADDSNGEGFIAHELAEVVPGCVTGEKDAVDEDGNPKYQGIDTSFLVATLTAAIQEQQAIIESLTARIEALENQT